MSALSLCCEALSTFSLPDGAYPRQYLYRACESKTIYSSSKDLPVQVLATRIALAELGQFVCFIALTVIFSLAYAGVISPLAAGIVGAGILPVNTFCSYHTFVHYKSCSRVLLTLAAACTLSACAVMAICGVVQDSAITLCGGGIILHLFRNGSEYLDARRAGKDKEYQKNVINLMH
jgi:hypothetical protein